MKKNLKKLRINVFSSIGFSILFFLILSAHVNAADLNFNSEQKNIELTDGGMIFELISKAQTVGDFLNEQKITLGENDLIIPDKNEKIFSGTHVIISRAKKITIKEGGKTFQTYTLQNTIEQAIWENKDIQFSDDDITNPSRQTLIKDGMAITVTHVLIKEETQQQDIDYNTISNNDDSLGWRIKKVTQKGAKGIREIKYKVVYYDDKEISRKILENNIISNPTDEIVTQGTYVKTGKSYTGAASWYAFRGGMFAANPWLPMGSYVRVTNKDNGQFVIVQINDRGPFGNGRIIDLDKIAFEKIASLGAGVANVKVEVVLN
jgi:uncharacterized protein YabE (DUF348 family)